MAPTTPLWPVVLAIICHSCTLVVGTATSVGASTLSLQVSSLSSEQITQLSSLSLLIPTGGSRRGYVPQHREKAGLKLHSWIGDGTSGGRRRRRLLLERVLGVRGGGGDAGGDEGIDEDLYSRQLYVMGKSAMAKMGKADVLISGMSGLGAEVAKNVILAGVRSVTVHDNRPASMEDLSSQFCFGQDAAAQGVPRARASVDHLRELNPYVDVRLMEGRLTEEMIESGGYSAVLLVDEGLGFQIKMNEACRRAGTAFVSASSRGVFASLFCDFGDNFVIEDEDGEEAKACLVGSISREDDGAPITGRAGKQGSQDGSRWRWVVDVVDGERHEFQTGDIIRFEGLRDAEGAPLDTPGEEFTIKVMSPTSFSIEGGQWAGGEAQKQTAGGRAVQVKKPSSMSFLPLREALRAESVEGLVLPTDFAKLAPSRQLTVHACFLCLDDFRRQHDGRLPSPGCKKDAEAFVKLVKQSPLFSPKLDGTETGFDGKSTGNRGGQVDVDENVARAFSRTCAGGLSPVAGLYGGVAAQEVLKGCSSLFVPTRQFLYYDCVEALPDPLPSMKACAARGDRYDGQRAVLGDKLQCHLSSQNVFLVGAGAIGCELLKSLALMGVGCLEDNTCSRSNTEGGAGEQHAGSSAKNTGGGDADDVDVGARSSGFGTLARRFRKTSHKEEKGRTKGARESRGSANSKTDVREQTQREKGAERHTSEDDPTLLDPEKEEESSGNAHQVVSGKAHEEEEPADGVGDRSRSGNGVWGKGGIVVTDMDKIEKSNLNRQFLFRSGDVGKAKSAAAAAAARKMNPFLEIKSLEKKRLRALLEAVKGERTGSFTRIEGRVCEIPKSWVGPETETFFDEDFWESLDCVVNALDNVEARLYVDSKCVDFARPLLESGTLGTKGNTQVVLPFRSESYGSSVDPEDGSIPLCTLKHHPYLIEHTVHWARDTFDGLFQARPRNAERLLRACGSPAEEAVVMQELRGQGAFACWQALRDARADLESDVPTGFADCLDWAKRQFVAFFQKSAEELLAQHPPGSVDDEGDAFWGGVKRPPTPLKLDSSNLMHREFVWWTALLRAGVFGIGVPRSVDDMAKASSPSSSAQNQQQGQTASRGPDDGRRVVETSSLPLVRESDPDEEIEPLIGMELAKLREAARRWRGEEGSEKERVLRPAAFEKDDDLNGHVDFVTAASNLRALNYGIPVAERLTTKRIAGKIVPAIATTTAVVSGLACIELLKLIQEAPIEKHKNGFVNLAAPFIAFSEPLEAEPVEQGDGAGFTIWDKVVVDGAAELTPRGLVEFLKAEHGAAEVTMISYNNAFLYASFMHDGLDDDDDSFSEEQPHPVLDTPLWKLADDLDGDGAGEDWMSREGGGADLNNEQDQTATLASAAPTDNAYDASGPRMEGTKRMTGRGRDESFERASGVGVSGTELSPTEMGTSLLGGEGCGHHFYVEAREGAVANGPGWGGSGGGDAWGQPSNADGNQEEASGPPPPWVSPSDENSGGFSGGDGGGWGSRHDRGGSPSRDAAEQQGRIWRNGNTVSSWGPPRSDTEVHKMMAVDTSQSATASAGDAITSAGKEDSVPVVDWFEEEFGGGGGQVEAEQERSSEKSYQMMTDDGPANGHSAVGNYPLGGACVEPHEVPGSEPTAPTNILSPPFPGSDPWRQRQYAPPPTFPPPPPPPLHYEGDPRHSGVIDNFVESQKTGDGWAASPPPLTEKLILLDKREPEAGGDEGDEDGRIDAGNEPARARRRTSQAQSRRRRRYLDLEVFCDDEDGEELRLPPVRLDMRSASRGAGTSVHGTRIGGGGRKGDATARRSGSSRGRAGVPRQEDDEDGTGGSAGRVAAQLWSALRSSLRGLGKEQEEGEEHGLELLQEKSEEDAEA